MPLSHIHPTPTPSAYFWKPRANGHGAYYPGISARAVRPGLAWRCLESAPNRCGDVMHLWRRQLLCCLNNCDSTFLCSVCRELQSIVMFAVGNVNRCFVSEEPHAYSYLIIKRGHSEVNFYWEFR